MNPKNITEQEQEADIGFGKALKKVEKKSILDVLYFFPREFVRMVAKGNSNGMILWGQSGYGKSYLVKNVFMEEKIPFIYHTGHITTLQLYQFIYKHKEDNIVFDDIDLLSNDINLNILKSCLDDDKEGERVICYSTTSKKLKVPDRFIFQGTIILLLNEKPKKNADLSAVESRVLNYELTMDYTTKIKVMFELAKQDYKDISQDDRFMVVRWIKDNTSQITRNLNLRHLFHIFEMFRFNKERWKDMAKQILIEDEEKRAILDGMTWQDWIIEFGKSSRTFRRYKKELGLKRQKKDIRTSKKYITFRSPSQVKTSNRGGKLKMADETEQEETTEESNEDNEDD